MVQAIVQRRLLLLVLVLLLTSVGMASARSSTNYVLQRSVTLGGGSADSAEYSVTAVIGQPATGVASSANFKISAGFLHPQGQNSGIDYQLWLPLVQK